MVVHLWDLVGDSKVPSWNYAKNIEGYRMSMCGYQRKNVTTNRNEVTCKMCLKKMNK